MRRWGGRGGPILLSLSRGRHPANRLLPFSFGLDPPIQRKSQKETTLTRDGDRQSPPRFTGNTGPWITGPGSGCGASVTNLRLSNRPLA